MEPSRIKPVAGALFAVNMLTSTQSGGTYTFDEFKEDLTSKGFSNIKLLHQNSFMNSLIRAEKSQ